MWNNKSFTENELSIVSKLAVLILLVIPIFCITINNIVSGNIEHPYAFTLCILGFIFFTISKVSLFRKGSFLSFGGKRLTENMLNCYRLGYWLMAMGLLLTFTR